MTKLFKEADIAEIYCADAPYAAGTVLQFGGDYEVCQTTEANDRQIAGIVSTNPAHLLNSEQVEMPGSYCTPIALQGRVPCKVTGKVKKGDLMVSSEIPGTAERWHDKYLDPRAGSIIGKALEDKDDLIDGVIEVVVGRL